MLQTIQKFPHFLTLNKSLEKFLYLDVGFCYFKVYQRIDASCSAGILSKLSFFAAPSFAGFCFTAKFFSNFWKASGRSLSTFVTTELYLRSKAWNKFSFSCFLLDYVSSCLIEENCLMVTHKARKLSWCESEYCLYCARVFTMARCIAYLSFHTLLV